MGYVKEEQNRITNRHIAKVLSRLSGVNLPLIVSDEVKRQMWFLSEDLVNMCQRGEGVIDGKQIQES